MEQKHTVNIIVIVLDNGKIALEAGDGLTPRSLPILSITNFGQPIDTVKDYIERRFGVVDCKIDIADIFSQGLDGMVLPSVDLIYRVNLSGRLAKKKEKKPIVPGIIWLSLSRDLISSIKDRASVNILGHLFGWVASSQVDATTTVNNVEATTYIIYSDGASRGNPGHSASAYVIYDDRGGAIISSGEYLGITTSTFSEYYAVKIALEAALEIGARSVECRIDNLSTVNQLNSVYRVKNRDVWPVHESIIDLMKKFQSVRFVHVNREYNKEADLLANDILDNYAGRKNIV